MKLKPYIPDPVVTTGVLQILSNKIYLTGKVNRPGEHRASHYMDVLQGGWGGADAWHDIMAALPKAGLASSQVTVTL